MQIFDPKDQNFYTIHLAAVHGACGLYRVLKNSIWKRFTAAISGLFSVALAAEGDSGIRKEFFSKLC